MTIKGHHPLPQPLLKQMARLMQIHLLTHPERVARRLGVSAEYVRQQWRRASPSEMAPLESVIDQLRDD